MLKAKQKTVSILLAGLTMLAALVFGFVSFFKTPTTTASAAETTVTMEIFGSKGAKTGSGSSEEISWTQDGITFVNKKASSSNAIRNSDTDHYRAYVNSEITVTVSKGATLTKIVFTTTSSSYNGGSSSTTVTYSASGTTVTVTPKTESSTVTFKLSKQLRIKTAEVTYEEVATCGHENKTTTTTDATCTQAGTITVTCDDCGETISTKTVEATGHKFAAPVYTREGDKHTATGTCTVCSDTTSLTEDCTLTYKHVSNNDGTHNTTSTCSVCEKSSEAEETQCSFEKTLDETTWVYTCKDCKYSYTEAATVYTVNFVVPNAVAEIDSANVVEGYSVELPKAGTLSGYNFVGWTTAPLTQSTTQKPELYDGKAVTADVTLYALYAEGEESWELVTDESQLSAGKEIVITASDTAQAMGAARENNRAAVNITKDKDEDNNQIITWKDEDDVQIITLEAGTKANTFAFNVGNGYLYAASSSSNHLKTGDKNDNASWLITIDDSIATIKAQGSSTRNWLRYNSTNNPPLFSCYSKGQADVSIYMKTDVFYMSNFARITSASITIGQDLTMNYKVTIADTYAGATMRFTMNDNIVEVDGTLKDGQYVYSFNVAPHRMADSIKAELIFDGEVIAAKEAYSVQEYAENKLVGASGELAALLKNLLNYGAQAQDYKNQANNLDNVDGATNEAPAGTDFSIKVETESAAECTTYFTAVGVYHDNVNKIYVKVNNYENATIKVNGTEYALESNVFYTDDIYATGFGDVYTFELYEGGKLMETLTYSVNSNVYEVLNKDSYSDIDKAFVSALYNYGVSAQAYAATLNN